MNKLFFVPVGGLANRMRAVASACTLARKVGIGVSVVWFKDWALNAPFNALFQPIQWKEMAIREATFYDYWVFDRPRKKNFFVPRFFQRILFDDSLYEKQITPLCKQHFDFEAWAKKGEVYLASYTAFQKYDYALLRKLFVPRQDIQEKITSYSQSFSDYSIGIHIRRTDNAASIQQSPTELFIAAIDREIEANPNVSIFLATDSEIVKKEMLSRYGNRVLTAKDEADRNSIAGIKGGIIDMFTLSKTNKIYGSFQSSFSELAAQIGNVPIEILKKG